MGIKKLFPRLEAHEVRKKWAAKVVSALATGNENNRAQEYSFTIKPFQ
jgi:hypothetical protein